MLTRTSSDRGAELLSMSDCVSVVIQYLGVALSILFINHVA